MDDAPFDVDLFLRRPLVARLASSGPTVRPVWYLWEDGAFWWLTGSWSRLRERLADDPRVALVVDTCDLSTGDVRQVVAVGDAATRPFDADRARRKLRRYLGPDEARWDERFRIDGLQSDAVFVRLVPERLIIRDQSFTPAGRADETERG